VATILMIFFQQQIACKHENASIKAEYV